MLSDLRFTFRSLLRNRTFALAVILTLALGIGAAASIFSVTDWILFRANRLPDDVYMIGGGNNLHPFLPARYDFMTSAYEAQVDVIAACAKGSPTIGNIVIDGEPVSTRSFGVSTNFFPLLGISPAWGRGFLPGEGTEGADQVVIVSHEFWQRHLGGRQDALGRKITVGSSVCTVVGILRDAQLLPSYFNSDVYRPLTYRVDPAKPWAPTLFVLAKLRPNVTRAQAAQALLATKVDPPAVLRQDLADDHPVLATMAEVNQLFRAEIYGVMAGAVGLLYAIACLNASNLMLVRLLGQRRELSIRLALGGGRWRIVRLLAVESAVLAAFASLVGLLVANWFFPLLLSAAGGSGVAPDWTSWTLGWRVAGVLGLLTIATSLLIVVVPAFRVLRSDISSGLKDGGAALGESRALARLRGTLVILQAAFAVILLAGAGLMIHTFHRLQEVDLGFDPAGRAKVLIGFPADYPGTNKARLARLREIQAELQRLPGVRAVGFGNDILLPGYYYASHTLEGPQGRPIKAAMAGFNIGYHEASGLQLKRGRWLTQPTGNEILVNESFARACWPDEDPIGQLVRPVVRHPRASADWKGWMVVGVVGDVRASMREAPGLFLYIPEGLGALGFNSFIVRLSRDYDEVFASAARRSLYAFDPRIVIHQIIPLGRLRDDQLWAEHLADSVLKVLAAVAVGLTVVGIFSVLAYTVDSRMGEFGVRMALGATRRDLVKLVLRRGLVLTLAGVALGLAGSLALTRSLQSLLFETSASDPRVLVLVSAVLVLTSILACVLPACRATRVDVARLLRSE